MQIGTVPLLSVVTITSLHMARIPSAEEGSVLGVRKTGSRSVAHHQRLRASVRSKRAQ